MTYRVHAGIADARGMQISTQAQAFLPVLLQILDAEFDEAFDNIEVVLWPLYNCRERGYCLVLWPAWLGPEVPHAFHLFFAEDRCSDRFFLWTWQAKIPALAPPELGAESATTYESRKSVPYLRFDMAHEVVKGAIEEWLATLAPEEPDEEDEER